MPSYVTAKKNTEYIFYAGLPSQADTKLNQTNPTIAAGDFKVSIDGAAFANLGTLPAVTPAAGKAVKITLSASEMNGDNIIVSASDAAGAEWCDQLWNIQTTTYQIDDIGALTATSAEPGQGAPPATATLLQKIGYLYKAWRNRTTQTATATKLYADDATTVDQKVTVSDDGVTFDKGEVATGP